MWLLQTRYAQALGLMQQALPDHENCPHAASRLREVIVFEDMLGLKLEFAAHGNMLRRYEAAKALASHRYGPGSHGLLWSEEAAREIVRPLIAALHHCHHLRVVHRCAYLPCCPSRQVLGCYCAPVPCWRAVPAGCPAAGADRVLQLTLFTCVPGCTRQVP